MLTSTSGFGKKGNQMNIKNSLLVGIAACCSSAAFADTAMISIRTSGQGQISGSCTKKGYDRWIEISSVVSPRDVATGMATGRRDLSSGQASGKVSISDFNVMKSSLVFDSEISSPRDQSTGLATGKRMHKPFTFTCSLDRVGQQMMQAFMNNEQITELRCCIVADNGTMRTCIISGASLDEVSFTKSENGDRPMESISFNYTKIEWDLAKGTKG